MIGRPFIQKKIEKILRCLTYLVAYREALRTQTAEVGMTFLNQVIDELRGFRSAWQDCRPLAIAGLTLASALRTGLADTFALGLAFFVFAALAWGREVPDGRA
jgi:hypothetical protein